MGLEVERFEAAVVHVLDLGERVLDDLACDARADAGEQEEGGFEGKVRFNDGPGVVVVGSVDAEGAVERIESRVRLP